VCEALAEELGGATVIFDRTGDVSLEEAQEFLQSQANFQPDPHHFFVLRNASGLYLRNFYAGKARVVSLVIFGMLFAELRTAVGFGISWERVCDFRQLPVRIYHVEEPSVRKVQLISVSKGRRAEPVKPRWSF
jgi:hypothetical protein